MLPIFKSMDSQWRVQETPTSLINPPALRATTSQESTVLLISKPLRGCLRGNTPYSSGYRAWLFRLNPFHSKGFHRAESCGFQGQRHRLDFLFLEHALDFAPARLTQMRREKPAIADDDA